MSDICLKNNFFIKVWAKTVLFWHFSKKAKSVGFQKGLKLCSYVLKSQINVYFTRRFHHFYTFSGFADF